MQHAASYIHRQLKKLGYNVSFASQTDILLSWGGPAQQVAPLPVPTYDEPGEEEFPTLVNLRKIANKIQKQNPGSK